MRAVSRKWNAGWVCAVVALVAATTAAPAGATTLLRAGLDQLVAGNRTAVVGEVLDVHSYWNADGTFILTDVRVGVVDVLHGSAVETMTLTVQGGTVADLTVLIVGGPELIPGRSYVLFAERSDLPGAPGALTVPDLSQGVFDLQLAADGVRAVSQAAHQPLVPDVFGETRAPGGTRGLALADMIQTVRDISARQEARRQGVNR